MGRSGNPAVDDETRAHPGCRQCPPGHPGWCSDKPQRDCDLGRLGLVDGAVMAYDKILRWPWIRWQGQWTERRPGPGCQGRLVTPGLVDPTPMSSTSAAGSGSTMRLQDPHMRSQSRGGILNSVNSVGLHWPIWWLGTRSLRRMLAFGVTTVEAKSGYGLVGIRNKIGRKSSASFRRLPGAHLYGRPCVRGIQGKQ